MIQRLTLFLGPERLRLLFLLLATTGLTSLVLNAVDGEWVTTVQTGLAVIFIVGALVIVGGRMTPFDRGRLIGLALPALGAVVLALLVLPQYAIFLIGGAVGWVLAGLFLFNPKGPMQYERAVKHLRKGQYAEAVSEMDDLIKSQPKVANHYRFRAELLRLWGRFDRARRDYQRMIDLEPDSALGYNGLAEVYLQERQYDRARDAAQRAYALAPAEWVAAYNLGMIEDRLALSEAVITHLRQALALKVGDARHRLLIHLYLVRAYVRLGQLDAAQQELAALNKLRGGLNEWQVLFQDPKSETLRMVIEDDVKTAEALMNRTLDLSTLKGET